MVVKPPHSNAYGTANNVKHTKFLDLRIEFVVLKVRLYFKLLLNNFNIFPKSNIDRTWYFRWNFNESTKKTFGCKHCHSNGLRHE